MAENIDFAGQVVVEEVTIITSNGFYQSITNQVAGVQIFEDIFSPFISGNIVVRDSFDFTNLFPLVGEELVRIKIHTPTFSGVNRVIDSTFYVYKQSDKEEIRDKVSVYRLHFISIEAIVDVNKRLSMMHKGKCSDIVSEIVTSQYGLQTKKQLNVESTTNGVTFISNFWNPVKSIQYVCERAVNKNNNPSFLFFENRNGLNFISLESLYTAPVLYKLTHHNGLNSSDATIETKYNQIRVISIPNGFDYLEAARGGMYASKSISFDPVAKRYSVKNYDMLESFSKEKHLNSYPVASIKSIRKNNSTIAYIPKANVNFSNTVDNTDSRVFSHRLSLMKRLDHYKVEITLAGRTDYTIGQKVNLTLFKNEPIAESESNSALIDKINSGNYIISAINHVIDRERHDCSMELIRDSLMIDLEKGK